MMIKSKIHIKSVQMKSIECMEAQMMMIIMAGIGKQRIKTITKMTIQMMISFLIGKMIIGEPIGMIGEMETKLQNNSKKIIMD